MNEMMTEAFNSNASPSVTGLIAKSDATITPKASDAPTPAMRNNALEPEGFSVCITSIPPAHSTPRAMLLAIDEVQNVLRAFVRHDGDHADAHVEDLVKFGVRHTAALLDDLEDGQHHRCQLHRVFRDVLDQLEFRQQIRS